MKTIIQSYQKQISRKLKTLVALTFFAGASFAHGQETVEGNDFQSDAYESSMTFSSVAPNSPNQLAWLKTEVAKWKASIPVNDPYTTVVNNTGDGDASLYGTRNLRVVLYGVYYRGGANNYYLKPKPRDNMNPLPEVGLKNLCQKGFSEAFYFYGNNFNTASPVTQCTSAGQPNRLDYKQNTATSAPTAAIVLKEIYRRIKGEIPGPIYGHCWNGWHASGYIAALALQQFCHRTKDETLNYWIKNTAGYNHGYYSIKDGIKNFQRIPALEISAEESQLICPQNL